MNPDIVSPVSINLRRLERTLLGLNDQFHWSEKTAITCVMRGPWGFGGCGSQHGEHHWAMFEGCRCMNLS